MRASRTDARDSPEISQRSAKDQPDISKIGIVGLRRGLSQYLCGVNNRGELLMQIAESRRVDGFRRAECPIHCRAGERGGGIGNHEGGETEIAGHADRG